MTLIEFIEHSGTSQKIFARLLGVSQSTMWRLCNRKHSPSLKCSIKILKLTYGSVSLEELCALPENKYERKPPVK